MSRDLNIVAVGHVDHGKSTLIGRLLHETGSLPEGKLDELLASSRRRGVPMEWSFALDALQAERDQAVTIDTTRVWLRWKGRRYAIIDAPGHRQFISNMLSGASEADAGILMVDVAEGVGEQTRRHAYLLRLLGIAQVVVAINKMDAVGYDARRFAAVSSDIKSHLASLDVSPAAIIPISAREGDNLVTRSGKMTWYEGPSLLEMLEAFSPAAVASALPFRLRVQDVYREGTRRVAVGRVESGFVSVGDTIVVSPAGVTARVKTIERWPESGSSVAGAGESIGFTVDSSLYVERGDVISHEELAPHRVSSFTTTLFWLDEQGPKEGESFKLQLGPTEARVRIETIERVVDTETLKTLAVTDVRQYAVVEARMRSNALVPLDLIDTNPRTARAVLLRGGDVVAGGLVSRIADVSAMSTNVHPHEHLVSAGERALRNGHRGAVIWLTGLSGAGKSTLAMAVERRLFARGAQAYVLDGDNVRSGLNRDLGFSPQDRAENIRRVGEVAALFADAGTIVVTAFISPFRTDREAARAAAGDKFHEVYVDADLATCEARDPKGLYRRARVGEIRDFTGVSAPYEAPVRPEIVIDTARKSLEECVEELLSYILSVTGEAASSARSARVKRSSPSARERSVFS